MANCPSCSAEVTAGARWCGICHVNVVNQDIGRLAAPGKRLGACALDLLVPVVAIVVSGSLGAAGVATETETGALIGNLLSSLLLLAYIIGAFVLFARGTTPGKKLLGMHVIREDGRNANFFTMLIRETVGKSISSMIFFLGFLWILFDQGNQGWHDKLMSTYVVQ